VNPKQQAQLDHLVVAARTLCTVGLPTPVASGQAALVAELDTPRGPVTLSSAPEC